MYELYYYRLSTHGIVHRQMFVTSFGAHFVAYILGRFGGDYYNFKIYKV